MVDSWFGFRFKASRGTAVLTGILQITHPSSTNAPRKTSCFLLSRFLFPDGFTFRVWTTHFPQRVHFTESSSSTAEQ
jgi:hypothetical protein